MRQRKENSIGMGTGTSLIMMIFVVLCLTAFATLSYLQARADLKKSEQYRTQLEQYYQADQEAVILQFQAQSLIKDCATLQEAQQRLEQAGYKVEAGCVVAQVAINQKAWLDIRLRLVQEEKIKLVVERWQKKSEAQEGYGSQGFDF